MAPGVLAPLFAVYLVLLFVINGVVTNILQATAFVLLRFVNRNLFRTVNAYIVELNWSVLVWVVEWGSGTKVIIHSDTPVEQMQKERCIMIPNHLGDTDWLYGWLLADRLGVLGRTKCAMKDELKYIPIFGWGIWFSEYLFLKRDATVDLARLQQFGRDLSSWPGNFWWVIFPEGTRKNAKKLAASQEFAKKSGKPIFHQVLLPRTKGFVTTVQSLRANVDAVYAMTHSTCPSMVSCIMGKPDHKEVHFRIKRFAVKDLPTEDAKISQWLMDVFESDFEKPLAAFEKDGKFDSKDIPIIEIERPYKTLILFIAQVPIMMYYGYQVMLSVIAGNVFATRFLIGLALFMLLVAGWGLKSTMTKYSTMNDGKKKK